MAPVTRGDHPPDADDAPDSRSSLNPADRLRAVYLLTQEFNEEEYSTASTDPPTSRATLSQPGFSAQPVDRPILLRLDGVQAGEVVSLGILPCVIGRHPSCTIAVDDAGVSRKHAQIVADQERLVLEDFESRNGTFIDGTRISRRALHDGCLIQIGNRVGFRYTVVDARQESLLRQLYRSSTRDALTGVFNRRHFDDRLKSELAFARRHGTEVALILVDVDHFKQVNDTHGHVMGDQVLKRTSQVLGQQLRTEDVLARVGGEEFAVVLRGVGVLGASRLAERLRAAVEQVATTLEAATVRITISLGCASLSELPDQTPEQLFATADARLYAAKRGGRNRVVYG